MTDTTAALAQDIRFTRLASGTRIAWARNGRADAPVLLRVAHWLTHVEYDARSALYRPWLERLGRCAQFVRYDERGCGLSGPDAAPLGLDAALEELEAVHGAIGAPRVALLGISGAAPIAVAFAARHPARVSRLVLLGGYLCGVLAGELEPERVAYFDALARLMEFGWGKAGSPAQHYLSATMLPDATPAQLAALNEQQRLSCDGARAAAILRARSGLDVRTLAPAVRCPTLVLHAAGDGMISVESGRELAAAIPAARFVTLPGRNHVPLPGNAAFDLFCDAVSGFLREGGTAAESFSAAERALLALVAQGRDNLQIAAALGVAEKTVRNRLTPLYRRLGAEGRPQAVVLARELGFG